MLSNMMRLIVMSEEGGYTSTRQLSTGGLGTFRPTFKFRGMSDKEATSDIGIQNLTFLLNAYKQAA